MTVTIFETLNLLNYASNNDKSTKHSHFSLKKIFEMVFKKIGKDKKERS